MAGEWDRAAWDTRAWEYNGPEIIADVFNGAPWLRGDAPTELPITEDGDPVTLTIAASRIYMYQIEVRDPDGVLVLQVPRWIATSEYVQELDVASSLGFKVPYADAATASLVRPNRVWLRDRYGFVLESFVIERTRKEREGDATWWHVECQSRLVQLGKEPVLNYQPELDDEDMPIAKTVTEHVVALLDLQQQDGPIGIGEIHAAIAETEIVFAARDTTILDALRSLQKLLPKAEEGVIYVDALGKLQWPISIGSPNVLDMTTGRNLRGLRYEQDWSELITRIYMYGEDITPDHQLNLTDEGAGEANEYLDSATGVAAYGVVAAVKHDRRVKYAETLLAMANRVLDEFSVPQVKIDVDVLDLAKSDTFPGWPDLWLGSTYRVVDGALGVDTEVLVQKISYNLNGNPLPVQVELANRHRRLDDLFRDMIDHFAAEGVRNYSGDVYNSDYLEGDVRNDGGLEYWDGDEWVPVELPIQVYPAEDDGLAITSAAGTVGTEDKYAREDHTHQGMPWLVVANYAALPGSADDGVIAYTASDKDFYLRRDGVWQRLVMVLDLGAGALDALPARGVNMRIKSGVLWTGKAGDSRYYPVDKYTTVSGTP